MSISIWKADLDTSSKTALNLIVGIDWALVCAVKIIFKCPSWRRAVLNACLSCIISVISWVGCTILDTSRVDWIFESHDGIRGTCYIVEYILDTHVFVESSA